MDKDFNWVIKVYNSCTEIKQLAYAKQVKIAFIQKWVTQVQVTDKTFLGMLDQIENLEATLTKKLS